ncbi:MAG: S8 family serine peptidase [Bacteroidia bacterium]|nr:S8 family serine peptidase [Bacteroidia bacterium]
MRKHLFINRLVLLTALFMWSSQWVSAQHSWVYFTDKCGQDSSLDAAVCNDYLNQLIDLNVEVVGNSKWLNAACVKGQPSELELLSFVDRIEPLGTYNIRKNQVQSVQEVYKYGNSDWQLEMLQLDSFHRLGYTGKGVTIALFDAGFYRADTLPAFDSLWLQNRIKGYWDFLRDDTTAFWEYDGHGKYVLSIAGANWPDSMMGAAPGANFLLARTEHAGKEVHLEEYAWVKALEWADSMGADIIHSSLGYSQFDTLEGDYTYEDMDGETTIITKATDIAFEKGIFVTNSAGNEGDDEWRYITAPCDGKHVLCVGAVDSFRMKADFSSFGPSFDGRVKPEVMAMGRGTTYINNQGHLTSGNGTSFSGPLIAGMVACLKEAWPDITNVQMFKAIVASSHLIANPDTFGGYGYGIPNVLRAHENLDVLSSVEVMDFDRPRVYPNPAGDFVVVESVLPLTEIRLNDLTGKTIASQLADNKNSSRLSLLGIEAGIYVLEVRSEGNRWHVVKLEKF